MVQEMFWGLFVIAVIGLGGWELRRWADPLLQNVITPRHKRRRTVGLILLLTIASMGMWSTQFPDPTRFPAHRLPLLQANEQFLYYGLMSLLVVAVLVVAYLEWKGTLLQIASQRRDVLEETIGDLPTVAPISGGDKDVRR